MVVRCQLSKACAITDPSNQLVAQGNIEAFLFFHPLHMLYCPDYSHKSFMEQRVGWPCKFQDEAEDGQPASQG